MYVFTVKNNMANIETARIKTDSTGNILVDKTGHVTCISEGIRSI